jgi:hypothetical protein
MAINKNHPFEDIDGIKCAVVETGVDENRKEFLKDLLEYNRYTVVVSAEQAKKAPAPASETEATETPAETSLPVSSTYKIGVTDVTFNAINAIFGRLLKTRDGRVVTMAYWYQKEKVSRDDIPYFESNN